ncbi:MAG: hypothetical protein WCG30_03880 [Candidatus Saccharibacteria bacterium]
MKSEFEIHNVDPNIILNSGPDMNSLIEDELARGISKENLYDIGYKAEFSPKVAEDIGIIILREYAPSDYERTKVMEDIGYKPANKETTERIIKLREAMGSTTVSVKGEKPKVKKGTGKKLTSKQKNANEARSIREHLNRVNKQQIDPRYFK